MSKTEGKEALLDFIKLYEDVLSKQNFIESRDTLHYGLARMTLNKLTLDEWNAWAKSNPPKKTDIEALREDLLRNIKAKV